jgi:O-phosphoseryl-tRNA(Cys) synthetase
LHEEEKGIVGDVIDNKKVNALNESLVFYKQGTMTNMELVFLVSTILKYVKNVVHCVNHIAICFLQIDDL